MRRLAFLAFALIVLLLAVGAAPKEPTECPRPSTSKRGFYLRGLVGSAAWTGDMGRDSRPGFSFTLLAGYEFFSFLALESAWTSGLHDTSQPYPPADAVLSTNFLQAGLRLSLPIDPIDLAARGGLGWLWTYPDVLVRVENQPLEPELAWYAGAGLLWHTPSRGFDVGLEVSCSSSLTQTRPWLFGGIVLGITLP